MLALAKRLVKEEEGQGLVEYALIIALIALAIFGLVSAFGEGIGNKFEELTETLEDAS